MDKRESSKHHLLTDTNGMPLAALASTSNRNEVTMLLSSLVAVPALKSRCERPRRKPGEIYADRA